jgi:hypothetical protein
MTQTLNNENLLINEAAAKRGKHRTISKNCRFKPSEIDLIIEAANKVDCSFSHLLRQGSILLAQEIVQRKVAQ